MRPQCLRKERPEPAHRAETEPHGAPNLEARVQLAPTRETLPQPTDIFLKINDAGFEYEHRLALATDLLRVRDPGDQIILELTDDERPTENLLAPEHIVQQNLVLDSPTLHLRERGISEDPDAVAVTTRDASRLSETCEFKHPLSDVVLGLGEDRFIAVHRPRMTISRLLQEAAPILRMVPRDEVVLIGPCADVLDETLV